jgi:hypothetical protein
MVMVRIQSIFELHILVDELTKDVSMVVDFAEKDEVDEAFSCGKIKYQT